MQVRELKTFIQDCRVEQKLESEFVQAKALKLNQFCDKLIKEENSKALVKVEHLSRFFTSVNDIPIALLPFSPTVKSEAKPALPAKEKTIAVIKEKVMRYLNPPMPAFDNKLQNPLLLYIESFCDEKALRNLSACSTSFFHQAYWQTRFASLKVSSHLITIIIHNQRIKNPNLLFQDMNLLFNNVSRFLHCANSITYRIDQMWQLQLLSGQPDLAKSALNMLSNTLEVENDFFHPLHLLCASDSLECVKMAVDQLSSKFFEASDGSQLSVFHFACWGTSRESLVFLLNTFCKGENYRAYVDWGRSSIRENILHSACRAGNLDAIDMITKKHIILFQDLALSTMNESYLHLACFSKSIETVYRVLPYFQPNMGFDYGSINAADKQGYTAFHYACMYGDYAMVKKLIDAIEIKIQKKVRSEIDNYSALHLACRYGDPKVVELLLKQTDDEGLYYFNAQRSTNRVENAFSFAKLHPFASVQLEKMLEASIAKRLVPVKPSRRCTIM
jgi:ankyrin repeat protein